MLAHHRLHFLHIALKRNRVKDGHKNLFWRIMIVAILSMASKMSLAQPSAQLATLQAQRLEIVRHLMRENVILRFTQLPDGSACQIEVGLTYHQLTFEDKQKWLSVPWTWCRARNNRATELIILDPQNHYNQIGLFTRDGLVLTQ